MSRIVTGTQPSIKRHGITQTRVLEACTPLERWIEHVEKQFDIPAEATYEMGKNMTFDTSEYTWTWWEITL